MGYRKVDSFLDRVDGEHPVRGKKGREAAHSESPRETGRVLATFGRQCLVRFSGGSEGRLPIPRSMAPVTGDIVESDGSRVVLVQPRSKVLARADAASIQVIAANIDRLVLVQSILHPPFREGLTDRYLVFATIMELPLILVLNKIDRAKEEADRIAAGARVLGIDVLTVSAKTGQGMDDLAARLQTGVSVFSGHSGVGKSSLLSHLLPGVDIRIGDLSTNMLGRQKTTTARSYPFKEGFLIDTPGIRQFGFVGVDPHEVARAFPEIDAIAGECRFRDCLHISEPDCAVKRSCEEGRIAQERYQSYYRIVASLLPS
jgi:ribosome biogenesis GTPase / thiamine phosphate phosphatase